MKKHFVNKYKSNHRNRKIKFHKMAKEGLITLLGRTPQGFLYEEVAGVSITISRKGGILINNNIK